MQILNCVFDALVRPKPPPMTLSIRSGSRSAFASMASDVMLNALTETRLLSTFVFCASPGALAPPLKRLAQYIKIGSMPLNPLRAPAVIEASVLRVASPAPLLTGQSIVSMPLAVSACADGAATSELVASRYERSDVRDCHEMAVGWRSCRPPRSSGSTVMLQSTAISQFSENGRRGHGAGKT